MIHVECPNQNISWTYAVGLANKDSKDKIDKNQPLLIASLWDIKIKHSHSSVFLERNRVKKTHFIEQF